MTGAYQRNGKRWGDSGQERIVGKTAEKEIMSVLGNSIVNRQGRVDFQKCVG